MKLDKSFYKNIFAIAIPIALQNLITLGTSMMDTIMLGRADSTGILFVGKSALFHFTGAYIRLGKRIVCVVRTVLGKRRDKTYKGYIFICS